MTKTQFKDYVPRVNGKRSIEEAIAEVQRELEVRKKIFDKWVADGRMSWMDAHDRMERLQSALTFLFQHHNTLDLQDQEPITDTIIELPHPSVNGLDMEKAIATA